MGRLVWGLGPVLRQACWSVALHQGAPGPAPPPSAAPQWHGDRAHSTGDSWMESPGFPSLIWKQKRRKLGGGTQASQIESTVITACLGFCCLLFAFLVEKLLVWGWAGEHLFPAWLSPWSPEKQANGIVRPCKHSASRPALTASSGPSALREERVCLPPVPA